MGEKGKNRAAGELTDEFRAQDAGFVVRARNMQAEVLAMAACRVRLDVSYCTPDHPSILNVESFKELPDSFSEGRVLADKLERLIETCRKIDVMSPAQAGTAWKKLDRIGGQVESFRRDRVPEGAVELLLLGDEGDFTDELAELPFESVRPLLLRLREERPGIVFEKASVSWREDDVPAAALRAARAAAVAASSGAQAPKPY